VCAYAKTLSDTVVFSGPLPNLINDELYSRMSSFNRWLSRWCPANNVGYVDKWKAFWGKPDLMRRDGIHPTLDGARLISANMTKLITGLNPWQPRVQIRNREQSCSLTPFSALPFEQLPTHNSRVETVSDPRPLQLNKSKVSRRGVVQNNLIQVNTSSATKQDY